jgi:hypothetical protein
MKHKNVMKGASPRLFSFWCPITQSRPTSPKHIKLIISVDKMFLRLTIPL